MGCKRPIEEVEFEELPFKHSRSLEFSNKPASFSEVVPCYNASQEHITEKDEGDICKLQWTEVDGKDTAAKPSTLVDNDFVIRNTFSVATNSRGEEVTNSGHYGATAYSPLFSSYPELDFPQRRFVPFEDVNSSYLDCPPRKQIPVGPNHQASIPIWRGNINEKKADQTEKDVDDYTEEKHVGTCVIPMPDSNSSALENDEVAIGRKQCHCWDAGSVRCVQQHVHESREILRKTLGDEKFVNLGFCEMGEASCKWSEEEQLAFIETVYSNPPSLGRNFWKHLSAVFPYRSKKELVSYYFNVFMLQRRATQNRSKLLDIDSDDDEWHESHKFSHDLQALEEDEDSAIESLGDEDNQSEEGSEDNDSSDGGDDYYGIIGANGEEAYKEDDVIDRLLEGFMPNFVDGYKFHNVDKISGNSQEYAFQDDSCMSFESQTNMSDSCSPIDAGAAHEVSETKNEIDKSLQSKPGASPGPLDHLYLSNACDAFDLLPSWNMIEDLFVQGEEDGEASRRQST